MAVGSTDAGLWSLGLREGADAAPAERRDLLANLLGLRIVLCCAGVVVGVLFTALTGRAFSLVWGVAAVGLGLTIAMLQQAVSIHLQLDLRYPVVALLEFVKTAALAITYAVLVLVGAGLGPFYFAPAIAGLALVAATALVVPLEFFRPRFHRDSWLRMGRAVVPYAIATAVAILYFRVTQIAMEYLANDREITQYALAFRIVEVLTVIPGLVASSSLPLMARARTVGEDRLRALATSLAQTALLAGIGLATDDGGVRSDRDPRDRRGQRARPRSPCCRSSPSPLRSPFRWPSGAFCCSPASDCARSRSAAASPRPAHSPSRRG